MTEQEISRLEWDFDTCPGEELELCFEYERSRDVPEDIKETERWRETYIKSLNSTVWVEQAPGATFDDYFNRDDYPLTAIHVYPEFPETPYLAIPPEERARRFSMLKEKGVYPLALEDDGSSIHEGFSNLIREFPDLTKDGTTHHGDDYRADGENIVCHHSTYAAFRFNWEHSEQTHLDALKAWLRSNRDPAVEVIRTQTLDFRARLRQLGAWRLLNKYAMTWNDAEEYSQRLDHNHKPLYSGQPSWIRARNEADRFLGMFNR